ncbi:hypothetical protein Pan181_20120 [Aeoliella mucimassa]|uniref:Uncharacterized protein n=1 Tax=Aeoliella mucimassa TaxID=2527972 RepID=A0A518AM68_9BACT|nr:hypothetical protein Pan181_20120 [Aeoliella mucimassa]
MKHESTSSMNRTQTPGAIVGALSVRPRKSLLWVPKSGSQRGGPLGVLPPLVSGLGRNAARLMTGHVKKWLQIEGKRDAEGERTAKIKPPRIDLPKVGAFEMST